MSGPAGQGPGRRLPGQYAGKANFRDRRAEDDSLSGLDVSEGGSVEVFESEDDAEKRTAYVEAIGERCAYRPRSKRTPA